MTGSNAAAAAVAAVTGSAERRASVLAEVDYSAEAAGDAHFLPGRARKKEEWVGSGSGVGTLTLASVHLQGKHGLAPRDVGISPFN